jgi:hypothetical protein
MTGSWHDKPAEEVAARLGVDTIRGLAAGDAAEMDAFFAIVRMEYQIQPRRAH